jgi:hypothetical protein
VICHGGAPPRPHTGDALSTARDEEAEALDAPIRTPTECLGDIGDKLTVLQGPHARWFFAMITGHVRWIELAWLSIAASLLAIVVSKLWPKDRNLEP